MFAILNSEVKICVRFLKQCLICYKKCVSIIEIREFFALSVFSVLVEKVPIFVLGA